MTHAEQRPFFRERAAGERLRDVILETVNNPQAREDLGWLVAAAITDRVQES